VIVVFVNDVVVPLMRAAGPREPYVAIVVIVPNEMMVVFVPDKVMIAAIIVVAPCPVVIAIAMI
jgi:hypothetical protein